MMDRRVPEGTELAAGRQQPLRVLFVYDCLYPRTVGGVEHRNHELGRALAARGHQAALAGFAAREEVPFPGGRIVPIGSPEALPGAGRRRSLGGALRLAAGAARLDLRPFDVVETANLPYFHVLPLARRCRRARRPLVVTWHEHWGADWRRFIGWRWPVYALAERLCVRRGDQAVAVSALTAGAVARRRRGPVPVVANGVDCAAVRAAAAGAPPGPPLVYAGRLVPEKRVDLLLAAVARLPAAEAGPLLAVIGDGPDRERLEALARGLGLAARVRFRGLVPTAADLWREMAGARVAVQPSAREGFGLFPLEAMAAGLPVVHCESPWSAVAELVRHDVEGLVTAPRPEALGAALAGLLADDPRRHHLAENARRRAAEFDWTRIAESFERHLRRLVAAGPNAAAASR
jgi:glycosyltransferase involved in cell wall biosynthesis